MDVVTLRGVGATLCGCGDLVRCWCPCVVVVTLFGVDGDLVWWW